MEIEDIKKKLLEQISSLPKEQASQLKQKLESLSDEEVRQIVNSPQNHGCLFCGIAEEKIETFKVYESSNILAILDINPASKGHILVFPRRHIQFLSQLPNDIALEIFSFVKMMSPIIIKLLNAQGITVNILQGMEQNIPHLVINLIPRYKEDKLVFNVKRQKANNEELEKISSSLRKEVYESIDFIKAEQDKKKETKPEEEKEMPKTNFNSRRIP